METPVEISSDGLKLSGVLHVPDDRPKDKRLPAFLILHGFGGSKDNSHAEIQAKMFCDWGYAALRFDFRGCGESEGECGRILCFDQVADTKNAFTFLAGRDEIDPDRIGVLGHSFGAAVAVYTTGIDERIAVCISSCGWGDGARKFRGQHPGEEAWTKFTNMLEEGRRHREETGKSLMVSRWDIVPIPEHLRKNLSPNALLEFPAETAQSMYDFRADDVVANIAPRPLLLIHASRDTVTPTEQSIELFNRAGKASTDMVLLTNVDHFPFSGENQRTLDAAQGWLKMHFPLEV